MAGNQGQKEIAACAESRFFPLFATNFMYSLMYSLLKIAVSRFLGKIIAIFFCPCWELNSDERYSPTQGHLAVSPPEILKIICCRCKKDCSGKQCSCKKLGLHFTEECESGRHQSARTSTYALETIRQKTMNHMSLMRNNTCKIKNILPAEETDDHEDFNIHHGC